MNDSWLSRRPGCLVRRCRIRGLDHCPRALSPHCPIRSPLFARRTPIANRGIRIQLARSTTRPAPATRRTFAGAAGTNIAVIRAATDRMMSLRRNIRFAFLFAGITTVTHDRNDVGICSPARLRLPSERVAGLANPCVEKNRAPAYRSAIDRGRWGRHKRSAGIEPAASSMDSRRAYPRLFDRDRQARRTVGRQLRVDAQPRKQRLQFVEGAAERLCRLGKALHD